MKDFFPTPIKNINAFSNGDEIIDLARAQSGYDCHYEVIDSDAGIIRSLMTGEDFVKENGFFLLFKDFANFPKDLTFKDAVKGEFYQSLIDGSEYEVLTADDEHHVTLQRLGSEEVRIMSKLMNCYFVKIKSSELPPIDKNGQYLLFEI